MVPKPVHVHDFHDFAGVGKVPALKEQLYRGVIERGDGVPEALHRAGIDTDRDGLLQQHGTMHLHLGGKHSDTLVFLIQYADRVVLLETNSHLHFRTQPAGSNILALNQAWLAGLEREIAEAALRARQAATRAEREASQALADRRAASIAAFKARLR